MRVLLTALSSGENWYWLAASDSEVEAFRVNAQGEHRDISLSDEQKTGLIAAWGTAVDSVRSKAPSLWDTVLQGPKADLPVAGQPGGEERFYIATDEGAWYRDVGYQWKDNDADGGPTYSWGDISGTGTEVTLANDAYETVDIGFVQDLNGLLEAQGLQVLACLFQGDHRHHTPPAAANS